MTNHKEYKPNITPEQAKEIQERFEFNFPEIVAWHKALAKKLEQKRIEEEIADQDIEDIEAACELYDRLSPKKESNYKLAGVFKVTIKSNTLSGIKQSFSTKVELSDVPICSACNGSGEGRHDGSTCQTCRSCGHEIDHAIGDFYD